MGLLFVCASAAMQSYCYFADPDQELKDALIYGGIGSLGLGTAFLTGAAAYGSPEDAKIGNNSLRIKNGNLVTGLVLVFAGAAMQNYCYFADPDRELYDNLFYSGLGTLGLGAVFIVGSAGYGPSARTLF